MCWIFLVLNSHLQNRYTCFLSSKITISTGIYLYMCSLKFDIFLCILNKFKFYSAESCHRTKALYAESVGPKMDKDPQFEEQLKHNAHLSLFSFANQTESTWVHMHIHAGDSLAWFALLAIYRGCWPKLPDLLPTFGLLGPEMFWKEFLSQFAICIVYSEKHHAAHASG